MQFNHNLMKEINKNKNTKLIARLHLLCPLSTLWKISSYLFELISIFEMFFASEWRMDFGFGSSPWISTLISLDLWNRFHIETTHFTFKFPDVNKLVWIGIASNEYVSRSSWSDGSGRSEMVTSLDLSPYRKSWSKQIKNLLNLKTYRQVFRS